MNKLSIGITIVLLYLFPAFLFSQSSFQKHFSGYIEYQQLARSSTDNSYVLAAATGTDDGLDFSALKMNASGEVIWNKTYAYPGNDFLTSMAVAPSGDVFLAGYTLHNDGHFDLSLMKLNASGNLQWYKTFGTAVSDISVSVGVTPTGDVFLTGNIDSDTKKHIWIIKVDGAGELRWSKIYGSPTGANMNILASATTKEGGLGIMGVDGQHNYFIKLNADGTEAFAKTHSTISYFEETSSLLQLNEGGYLFSGKFKDCDDELCTYIFAFMKLDENGNVSWSKKVARSESSGVKYVGRGKDAVPTSDGGLAFIGQLTDEDKSKLVVIKTNSNGSIRWTKAYGSADSYGEYAGIETTADGGLLFLGTENSNALLIKTNAEGDAACYSQQLNPVFTDDVVPKSTNAKFSELKDANVISNLQCTEHPFPVKDTLICDKILSVTDAPAEQGFRVYPNPFSDVFTIEVGPHFPTIEFELHIYNVLGEKVLSRSFPSTTQQMRISCDHMEAGAYFYEVRSNNQVVASGKLIRSR